MKVFSLFSGIGGFELGIIKAFWAENVEVIGVSEIDKFSSAVLAHRFPWVKNYGDVSQIDTDVLPDFDILVGGSPCQDLSIAKRERKGLLGNRSGLFLEYLRILREKKPAYFVLENVASMNKDDRDFISEMLGVEPIQVNSALLTAQNRNRYYRTNIPNVSQPEDANIHLEDILEEEIEKKYFVDRQAKKGKQVVLSGNEPTPCPLVEVRSELGKQQREQNKQLFGIDRNKRNKDTVYYTAWKQGKSNCLTGGIRAINWRIVQQENGYWSNSIALRSPTPTECERLQGFPDDRTYVPRKNRMMSDTQRFKQVGNAVTVDVIEHIFSCLKSHLVVTQKGGKTCNPRSWFVPPLPVSKKTRKKKKTTSQKQYVAYYKLPGTKKKGLKLASQKAIIEHFVKLEKYILLQEFIEQPNKQSQLHKAIALCRKHKAIFIVATLDCISKDEHTIFSTKKKLGNLFRSCDLPTSDSLTLSIALGLQHRKFELASIKTKAALQACKVAGKQLGNTQNLTKEGRKMGLASITSKTTNTPRMEKVIRIIEKCRKAGMGWGSIARGLNESGYKTARGMEFSKMAVKRMRNG